MQTDDQILPVTHIEAGCVIRFSLETPDPGDTHTIIQGVVTDVEFCDDCGDGASRIFTIDNVELFIFTHDETVEVVGFVNDSYLDFIHHPEDFTN